ncbi:MAG: ABC transporter permease subunit [Lentisphaeria bacterium]|nr:ABC transporter permease subunit [Lentisphaeria bacterium]
MFKQKLINAFELSGLTWFIPIIKLLSGENPKEQGAEILRMLGLPIIALSAFFFTWGYLSTKIQTSVGKLPSPVFVWNQSKAMIANYRVELYKKAQYEKFEAIRSSIAMQMDKNVNSPEIQSLLKDIDGVKTKFSDESEKLNEQIAIGKEAHEASVSAVKEKYNKPEFYVTSDDGQPLKDMDGNPQLNREAVDEINLASEQKYMVYEMGIVQVLNDFSSSYGSLASRVSKVQKYQNEIDELTATGGDEKKLAKAEKRKQTFLKLIRKETAYSGNGSIIDYIKLSIITVLFGFAIAATVAIPLGIICGLSTSFMTAINPLIQVFRPVSPLAWVLITIQIVDGIFVGDLALEGDVFKNTFLHAGITVALCSMWATLSNTALGVSSIDTDYMNVAKVLKLNWFDRLFKIIIPAAIPFIFTGLRITLGVGWMVLIVSEMMATSRGLGWYIDQQYQNNKVESLANIIVCIFIIGLVGACLDRIMYTLQRFVSFNDEVSA